MLAPAVTFGIGASIVIGALEGMFMIPRWSSAQVSSA
jgi:hypothetical protein